MFVCMCVCVCVRERESKEECEREVERGRDRKRQKENKRQCQVQMVSSSKQASKQGFLHCNTLLLLLLLPLVARLLLGCYLAARGHLRKYTLVVYYAAAPEAL